MFHIVFNADENYIKYTAVLITSIVKNTDSSKKFKDFFDEKALNSQLGGGDYEFQSLDDEKSSKKDENLSVGKTKNLEPENLNTDKFKDLKSKNSNTNKTKELENLSKNEKDKTTNFNYKNPNEKFKNSNDTNLNEQSKEPENSKNYKFKCLDYESLNDEEKAEGYVFHILSDKLSQTTQNKLTQLQKELSLIYPCEIHTHFVDENLFKDQPKWSNHTNNSAYYRILLARFLPQSVKRCLYLDVDMLVMWDLRWLFALHLQEFIIASTLDGVGNSKIPKSFKSRKNEADLKLSKESYFCSSFMLIDLLKFRAEKIEQKCLNFLSSYTTQVGDQDTLNVALYGKNLVLSQRFGFLGVHFYLEKMSHHKQEFIDENDNAYFNYTRKDFEASLKDIKIMHYTWGIVKPWLSFWDRIDLAYEPLSYPYYQTWWDIALQTPVFKEELNELYKKIKDESLMLYSKALAKKLCERDKVLQDKANSLQGENTNLQNRLNNLEQEKISLQDKIAFLEYSSYFLNEENTNLQNQITSLQDKLHSINQKTGAVQRVKNHLAYKLGKALINHSKSLVGFIKLPFVLVRIYAEHNKALKTYQRLCKIDESFKLPELESYVDYDEALKIQNYTSYKFGKAFVKALKTWHKGGVFLFLYKALKKDIM